MSTERYDAAAAEPPDHGQAQPRKASAISAWCVNYLATALERPPDQIDVGATFVRLGMDSVTRTSFMFAIEEWLNVTIPADYMLERSTIAQLADQLAARAGKKTADSTAALRAEGSDSNAWHRRGPAQPEATPEEDRTFMRRWLVAIGVIVLLGTTLWLTANIYFHCCTLPT